MLLNILQCTGCPPRQSYPALNVRSAKVERPCLRVKPPDPMSSPAYSAFWEATPQLLAGTLPPLHLCSIVFLCWGPFLPAALHLTEAHFSNPSTCLKPPSRAAYKAPDAPSQSRL